MTLKSLRNNPGKTVVRVESDGQTHQLRSGESINFATPMVVYSTSEGTKPSVRCFYYSSHNDTFVDKWFSGELLDLRCRTSKSKTNKFKVGDLVQLRSVLVQPTEDAYTHKFELNDATTTTTYTLRKIYGSDYALPPILNVTKVKEKNKFATAICMWNSRKTGRLSELELPTNLLILAEKAISQIKLQPHPYLL